MQLSLKSLPIESQNLSKKFPIQVGKINVSILLMAHSLNSNFKSIIGPRFLLIYHFTILKTIKVQVALWDFLCQLTSTDPLNFMNMSNSVLNTFNYVIYAIAK